jgi:hypothetical protein
MIAARTGGGVFSFDPYAGLMADLGRKVLFWSDELIPDALALIDSLKTSLFIRALTVGALTAPQAEFIERVHMRAAHKVTPVFKRRPASSYPRRPTAHAIATQI